MKQEEPKLITLPVTPDAKIDVIAYSDRVHLTMSIIVPCKDGDQNELAKSISQNAVINTNMIFDDALKLYHRPNALIILGGLISTYIRRYSGRKED